MIPERVRTPLIAAGRAMHAKGILGPDATAAQRLEAERVVLETSLAFFRELAREPAAGEAALPLEVRQSAIEALIGMQEGLLAGWVRRGWLTPEEVETLPAADLAPLALRRQRRWEETGDMRG